MKRRKRSLTFHRVDDIDVCFQVNVRFVEVVPAQNIKSRCWFERWWNTYRPRDISTSFRRVAGETVDGLVVFRYASSHFIDFNLVEVPAIRAQERHSFTHRHQDAEEPVVLLQFEHRFQIADRMHSQRLIEFFLLRQPIDIAIEFESVIDVGVKLVILGNTSST